MSEIIVPKLSIEHCIQSIILGVSVTIQGLNKPDRVGGYFSLFDFIDPAPLLIVKVGTFEPSESGRSRLCLAASQEKGVRLQEYPDHLSSFQSRNERYGKWGGAVRGNGYILSFSGLPEIYDELATVRVGLELGLFSDFNRVRQIAAFSENTLVLDLLKSFAR